MVETSRKISDMCQACGAYIEIMVYRGTGYCSVNCQKLTRGEMPVPSFTEDDQLINLPG